MLGVDPEPDMLAHAAAAEAGVAATTSWLLGSASDLRAFTAFLGRPRADALTISNAAHFIDTRSLARDLPGILAPGGTVGVIANGVPIWCQDSAWSAALREFVADRFGSDLSGSRYTDEATLSRCAADLAAAGFTTRREQLAGTSAVSPEWLLGNLFSAAPAEWLPSSEDRDRFAEEFAAALRGAQPTGDFVEDTRVTMVVAQRAQIWPDGRTDRIRDSGIVGARFPTCREGHAEQG